MRNTGLYTPGLDIITCGSFVRAMKALDPELVLVLNKRCYPAAPEPRRFEVYDRAAPGGPRWQFVMRVPLTDDGRLREPDNRELIALYEARGRPVAELIAQMEAREDKRERQIDRRIKNLSEDMYEIIWTLGRRLHGWSGTTVAWAARTDPDARERIRREAAA